MGAEIGDRFFNGVKGFATDIATSESINQALSFLFVVVAGFFSWVYLTEATVVGTMYLQWRICIILNE